MIEVLEEVHRATMMNPKAAALYGVLCQPGEKLTVLAWDGWNVKIQKPKNPYVQKPTWSTKHLGNSFLRLEACDLEGRPVHALCLSGSISPRCTDESISYYNLELEAVVGMQGGFTDMLVGRPGYRMVHLFDNGFR